MILQNKTDLKIIYQCYFLEQVCFRNRGSDLPKVRMREGWNDTGQKTAAELKSLRMLGENTKDMTLPWLHKSTFPSSIYYGP